MTGLAALLRYAGVLAFVFLILTRLKKRRDGNALTEGAKGGNAEVSEVSASARPIPPKPKRPPPKPKNRSEEAASVVGKLTGGG
eukprot:s422_g35.t1